MTDDGLRTSQLWLDVGGGHELQLRRVERSTSPRGTLLFLPGLFSDARFFLSSKGTGAARFFVDRGFRALLADWRGHGGSRAPRGRKRWSFDEHAEEDLPAFLEAASQFAGEPLFVVGHSMGGYVALAGLGVRPDLQQKLAGLVLLASAVNDYSDGSLAKRVALPAAALLSRLARDFPARRLRLGSSDEPALLMQQFASWARRRAFDSRDGTTDYFRALGRVELPVFAAVGAADRFHASPAGVQRLLERCASSDKTLLVCGRETGASHDFGHVDLVRGELAEREVLPRVQAWLEQRSPLVASASAF